MQHKTAYLTNSFHIEVLALTIKELFILFGAEDKQI